MKVWVLLPVSFFTVYTGKPWQQQFWKQCRFSKCWMIMTPLSKVQQRVSLQCCVATQTLSWRQTSHDSTTFYKVKASAILERSDIELWEARSDRNESESSWRYPLVTMKTVCQGRLSHVTFKSLFSFWFSINNFILHIKFNLKFKTYFFRNVWMGELLLF